MRDTPFLYAEGSEAPLYEWAEKLLVSIPDIDRTTLKQLARDTLVPGFSCPGYGRVYKFQT